MPEEPIQVLDTAIVSLASEAPVLRAFGAESQVLLSGEQTGGRYAMLLETTPPGMGPPPHKHDGEDEWFYPLEGEVEFLVAGEWKRVPVGSAVFLPRGCVHTFRNAGDTPLRQLIHVSPAGFEVFFARCAEVFAAAGDGPPEMERIGAIAAEHGIEFV